MTPRRFLLAVVEDSVFYSRVLLGGSENGEESRGREGAGEGESGEADLKELAESTQILELQVMATIYAYHIWQVKFSGIPEYRIL